MVDTFKVDKEIKQEYLNSKPTSTAESDFYVLRSADEFEGLISKPIYNMTYSELKEMVVTKFRNTTAESINKNVSILRTYIDFCIGKNLVIHGENRLDAFTYEEARRLVSKQVLLNRYPTKGDIKEYQNILYNEQDKALIELAFIGVRGRTEKENTFEEIINLRRRDIDEINNALTLTQNDGGKRILKVDQSLIQLLIDTYEEKTYTENNGEETANIRLSKIRETIINNVEDFVFRIPGKDKFKKFTPVLLNNRMRRYQYWLDNNYLTFNSLYFAGMLDLVMEAYEEKGEVVKDDYIDVCEKFNYDIRYYITLKNLFEQYKGALGI